MICEAQKYVVIEHCVFLRYENIIEVGYLYNYTEVRIDIVGSADFFYDFFAIAFTIKNLPTPFFVKDSYPLIKMAVYNGTGEGYGDFLTYTNFTVETTPAEVTDIGVVFSDIEVGLQTVKVVDTYFLPEQEMWNHTYFVVEYPPEIILPAGSVVFADYTDDEKSQNRTLIPC